MVLFACVCFEDCRLWRLMPGSGILFRNIIDLTAFDTFSSDIGLTLFKASGITVLKSPRMIQESQRSCSAPLRLLLRPGSGFFDSASDGGGTPLLFFWFFLLSPVTDQHLSLKFSQRLHEQQSG